MKQDKLQAQRAIAIVPSDTINIPDLSTLVKSSAATATTANKLVDSGGLFTTTDAVVLGAVVYNSTDGTIATVTDIDSATTLSLSADIMASGESYEIYNGTTDSCVLYVGVAGDMSVETAGGDSVLLTAHPQGYTPMKIVRVNSTGTAATNMVALW